MLNTEAQLARLLDEAAIRDVTARFADSAMRQDYEAFGKLWADDGEWTIGKPFEASANGADEVAEMLRNLWSGNEYFMQFVAQGVVEIDGDHATARWVCREAARA